MGWHFWPYTSALAADSEHSYRYQTKAGVPTPVVFLQIHPTTTEDGALGLQFEHPCLATGGTGGWMNRADKVEAEPVEVQQCEPADLRHFHC